MSLVRSRPRDSLLLTALGAIAGPLFVTAFTVIGAKRAGYDWKRHAVSSLGTERNGWTQRLNFVLTGIMYVFAASGLARSSRNVVGSRLVPALVGAAGVGLIGSGVFVTDPVGGFPPPSTVDDESEVDAITIQHRLVPANYIIFSPSPFSSEYLWRAHCRPCLLVGVETIGGRHIRLVPACSWWLVSFCLARPSVKNHIWPGGAASFNGFLLSQALAG
jgi:hypothetical protein